ncbi:hypothetical protein L207DRAFT_568700 [Hyaloscypha variabilis F]|uniref:F-box domain-containing protein n=1 Tax=Hyaloscypha variabilis (strain UAMH 11265 / GT02V1 / F) TaxID=1149755 RepID=A0A2J6RD56_HYAVF|nr:hypothetical protein L207DRAFT_568700 [Hyaloscypha variabilis F]
MSTNLPYEVKRLIYDYVDLETLKSLRLASASWAVVGLELLLLPSFIVKSHSIDVPRLVSIGASPNVSRQAAKVIKKVKFYSSDWDADYLRSIVCSRHSHLSHYEIIDFVPTRDENEALEELEAIIERRHLDDEQARDRNLLIHAFRQAPHVDALEIICPTPFKHRILRKVWEEYNMETYRSSQLEQGSSQLVDILSAAKEAGLNIHHLGHDQLTSYFFTSEQDSMPQDIYEYLGGLKSLSLTICDREQDFPSNDNAALRLRNIISSSLELENLYVKFELLGSLSLDFLPESPRLPTKLHSVTLCGITMDTARFIPFLEQQAGCLRRLSITSAEHG